MALTRSNKENEDKKNKILGVTPKVGDKPREDNDVQLADTDLSEGQAVEVEDSDPSAFSDEFDELAKMVEAGEGNAMDEGATTASDDVLAQRLAELEPLVGVVPEMTRENMAEYLDDWHTLAYGKSDEYQNDLRSGTKSSTGTFNTIEPVYAYRIYRGSMLASFKSAITSEFLLLQQVQDAVSRINGQVTIVEAKQMMGLGKGTKTIAVKVI